MRSLLALSAAVLLIPLLAGCAAQPTADERARSGEGPTVYGQLGVSVDHVSVD